MARSSNSFWLWWAAVVVYAIVSLGPSRGVVLCIGDDGHVGLEVASAQAACSDCLNEPTRPEGCCTNSDEAGTGCSCADILLAVDNPKIVRWTALDSLELPPLPCLVMNWTVGARPSEIGTSEIRARPTLRPGTRLPESLILRV